MDKIWDFEQFGDAPALIADTGATITYRELEALSGELEQAAGERAPVMFVCRNSTGALAGYAAMMNRGCPVLPVSV